MTVEMLVFSPGQVIGYVSAEAVDAEAVTVLGVDIAVMGAVDRLRCRMGDRPFRIVCDSDDELRELARFVSSLTPGCYIKTKSERGKHIRDFFGAAEVMAKL